LLKLEKKHIRSACLVFSRAFKDDPFNVYAFPDPEERAKKMPYAYQFLLRYYISYGRCYITSPKVEGVAVWIHSNNLRTSFWRVITSGAIWPAMKMGMDTSRRLQVLTNYIEKKHRQRMSSKKKSVYVGSLQFEEVREPGNKRLRIVRVVKQSEI